MTNLRPTDPASAPPHEDDAVRDRLVRFAGATVGLIGAAIAVLLALEDPVKELIVALHVVIACLGVGTLILDRRGHRRAAAHLLVWGCWCVASAVTAMNGGVRGPNLLNYPVLIVFAGWILGTRPTHWLVGLTGALLLVFVWGDGRGWFPPADYGNHLAYTAYLAGILTLTAMLTLASRASYLGKLERVRRVADQLAAREAELHKLYLAVEQSPESVLITDPAARIEYVNEAFVRSAGYARDEVIGRDPSMLGSTRTPRTTYEALWAALGRGETWKGEFVSRRKDGTEYVESAVVAPIRHPDGSVTHYVAFKQDISEKRRTEARIHHLAYYDVLTGLPNRMHLTEHLDLALARAELAGRQDALLLFNIDRFRNVNDARGHEVGDALIVETATRLGALMRKGDLLARIAADEFALLAHDLGPDAATASRHALAMADTIHADLMRPVRLSPGEEVSVTASLGIALFPFGRRDAATEILRRATTALHQAKAAGVSQTAFFEAGMGESAQQRFTIERELRRAIAAGELRLYLQPQVDTHGRWAGAETLVRWQHPTRGLLPPDVFVPIAEESDLIVQLGRWMLAESCRLMARETMAGNPVRLAVNVSPRHFRQTDFVDTFRALLAETGADPTQLTMEVTESLVIDDVEEAAARMRELAAMGVRFSVDDFGTGYSSLAYLKRLPIDELKIDKTFVQDAPARGDDAALVETILSVAHHMHLKVVAEGVETEEQAGFLADRAGGVLFQGYLFGQPEPADAWLERWRAGKPAFPVFRRRSGTGPGRHLRDAG